MENNFENLPAGTVIEIKGRYLAVIISLISSGINGTGGYDYAIETYPFSSMNMSTSVNKAVKKLYKNYPRFKEYLNGVMAKDITKVIFLGYEDSNFGKLMEGDV